MRAPCYKAWTRVVQVHVNNKNVDYSLKMLFMQNVTCHDATALPNK